MNDEVAAPGAAQQGEQQLQLQKVYIKDVSLETPNSPDIFTAQWKPTFNMQINTATKKLSDDVHEVVLSITVTAKHEEKTGFLIEIQQAGVFRLSGFGPEQLGPMLGAYCPNVLFPYARETVDSLVVRGGFPPLHLAPINFDAIYAQHVKAQQEQGSAAQH